MTNLQLGEFWKKAFGWDFLSPVDIVEEVKSWMPRTARLKIAGVEEIKEINPEDVQARIEQNMANTWTRIPYSYLHWLFRRKSFNQRVTRVRED
jgi:hypothetical protein